MMKKVLCIVAFLMVVWMVMGKVAFADAPWPMFHHDIQRTGKSPYNGPNSPVLKWSYTIGGYEGSSPAIAAMAPSTLGLLTVNFMPSPMEPAHSV